jgi:anti-anti-sigma factor
VPLTIQRKEIQPGIVVLELIGRLTPSREEFGEQLFGDPVESSQDLDWQLLDLLEKERKRVVFDLAGLQFVDSTGVGLIVKCSVALRKAGGELRVVGAAGWVEKTLKMMHIDQMIGFYPDIETAVADW